MTATRNFRVVASGRAGFSLIELLVGLAIGMIAILVIAQTMLFFEGQKRATTGSAGAQIDGGVALYSISREIQAAGFALLPVVNSPLECTRIESDHDADAGTPTIDALSPVVLIDGVSDTVVIHSGISQLAGSPVQIVSVDAGNTLTVRNNFGCAVNDAALTQVGFACTLGQVTALSAAPAANSPAAPATITLNSTAGAAAGGTLACLGAWQQSIYAVAGGALTQNGQSIIPNVVNIQAQYGISATASVNQVTQWVDPTGTWAANALTVANRNRIKAIRIAVVTRNGQLERDNVTAACSSLSAASPTGLCAWDATSANPLAASPAPSIDLSADANWQRYRYRVFDTIVPIRNVIWSRATL